MILPLWWSNGIGSKRTPVLVYFSFYQQVFWGTFFMSHSVSAQQKEDWQSRSALENQTWFNKAFFVFFAELPFVKRRDLTSWGWNWNPSTFWQTQPMDLTPLGSIGRFSGGGLVWGYHYSQTLAHWLKNWEADKDRIVKAGQLECRQLAVAGFGCFLGVFLSENRNPELGLQVLFSFRLEIVVFCLCRKNHTHTHSRYLMRQVMSHELMWSMPKARKFAGRTRSISGWLLFVPEKSRDQKEVLVVSVEKVV